MTRAELVNLTQQLKKVFDIVRLVNVSVTLQYTVSDDGQLEQSPYRCYAVWNKTRRCDHCVSAKAYACKGKSTKFEFIGYDVYYVISQYILVDNEEYMLEMVSIVTDESLVGAYGKSEFSQRICAYNKQIYTDALTGAYNRRYLDQQLIALREISAVAMVDLDHFKQVNDTYGHAAGDEALRTVAAMMMSSMRSEDAVIRYGGDEFLLLSRSIKRDLFLQRLESLRLAVSQKRLPAHPDLRLTLSIGVVCGQQNTKEAIQEADRLLYKAKEHKNCIEASE